MSIYAMKKPKRINSVSVSITLIALVFGYFGWFLIPVYWPNFQIGGVMRAACADAYRLPDDKQIMKKLVADSRRSGLRLTEDNFRFTRVPYTPEELTERKIDSNSNVAKRGKECILEFYYEDDYEWPLIGKKSTFTFEKTIKGDLTQVEW